MEKKRQNSFETRQFCPCIYMALKTISRSTFLSIAIFKTAEFAALHLCKLINNVKNFLSMVLGVTIHVEIKTDQERQQQESTLFIICSTNNLCLHPFRYTTIWRISIMPYIKINFTFRIFHSPLTINTAFLFLSIRTVSVMVVSLNNDYIFDVHHTYQPCGHSHNICSI